MNLYLNYFINQPADAILPPEPEAETDEPLVITPAPDPVDSDETDAPVVGDVTEAPAETTKEEETDASADTSQAAEETQETTAVAGPAVGSGKDDFAGTMRTVLFIILPILLAVLISLIIVLIFNKKKAKKAGASQQGADETWYDPNQDYRNDNRNNRR